MSGNPNWANGILSSNKREIADLERQLALVHQCVRCGGRFFLHPDRDEREGCAWCEWDEEKAENVRLENIADAQHERNLLCMAENEALREKVAAAEFYREMAGGGLMSREEMDEWWVEIITIDANATGFAKAYAAREAKASDGDTENADGVESEAAEEQT
ncbi:MAG: hypothetical protein V3V08_23440 [Nannocystaceae bacterium]